MENLLERPGKITIEDIAWFLYQGGIKVKWRSTPLKREDFSQYEDYKLWMDTAIDYIQTSSIGQLLRDKMELSESIEKVENASFIFGIKRTPEMKYPVIQVPSSGYPEWYGGARTMMFVYSRDHGNFILEGYQRECEEYLKANYTHYFYYNSMWNRGQSRGGWHFWKDSVGIIEPSKRRKDWKYTVRLWTGGRRNVSVEKSDKSAIRLKRLPKRWIPEFNRF